MAQSSSWNVGTSMQQGILGDHIPLLMLSKSIGLAHVGKQSETPLALLRILVDNYHQITACYSHRIKTVRGLQLNHLAD